MGVAHRGIVERGHRVCVWIGIERRGCRCSGTGTMPASGIRAVVAVTVLLMRLYMITVHDPLGVRVGNF